MCAVHAPAGGGPKLPEPSNVLSLMLPNSATSRCGAVICVTLVQARVVLRVEQERVVEAVGGDRGGQALGGWLGAADADHGEDRDET
ncbi:MAG: hypothetical protein E6J91_12940 [Deltaproteobacteria bacterium]|nr:MAG: hypothetical protein E6J91_12940 [Deltaproteobacteria bacterium]